MADISSVIRNPEVAQLTPVLLAALGDPANKTKEALEALMNCEFMHSIDAPSLALLVPILGRALRDRGADLKRKSAVITGNMCTMISDQSVLVPYLPQVVPDLKEALIDPIPDVRTVAAKALGSLIGGVGEAELADLIPWLLSTLQSNISSVERSGAAQGLAEVSNTLGAAKLHAILSEVLPWKNSKSSSAREGLMWLLSFLPAIQSSAFVSEIPNTLPVTLVGLGDTSESVREVALRSAQVLVATQGKQQFQLIIPSLIHGMSDPEWRLRQNSVILLGDLLYLIADTKAVGLNDAAMDDEDDGGMGGSNSRVLVTIRAIVGDEQTNLILASLYIARSDVGSTVRQVALQVWKSVVSNTPRTLIDIMPVLVDIVIKKLSAADDEERTVAARCLGEIVRKLGDRVLPVVIPYLRKGLTSDSISVRRGVCVGLSEILAASTSHQIEMYLDTLVPALQEALCDASSADVRSQGAVAFQTLFKTVGKPALDFVVPSLMTKIEATLFIFGEATEEAEITNGALLGMRELVAAKPRDVVEHLLPRLLATPLTVVNARVLGFISPSASGQLNYYYHDVVTQLIKELIASETRDIADNNRIADLAEVKRCAGCVMGATSDAGIQSLVIELGKQIDKPSGVNGPIDIKIRRWACWLISQLFEKCKIDFSDFMQIILKQLLSHSADSDREVLEAIVQALSAISAAVPLEELTHCNDFIVSCVQSTASDAKHRASGSGLISATDGSKDLWLPLFTLPKSLDPFVAVFIHALLNGSPQQREVAAQALGEFAQFADPAVLKPHLIKITGPLVRIVGDRVPSPVKFAILQTLCVLLRKGSAMLKAFVPQLQTTFVKALVDPSRQVRNQGAHALGQLMALSARIDPLMNELAGLVSNAEAAPLKVSALDAVSVVLQKGGDKVTAPVLSKLTSIIATASADSDESVRRAAAPCAGNFTRWAPSELVVELAEDVVSKPFPTGVISADATVFRNNTGGVSGAASVAAHILGNACSAVTVTAGIPSVTSTVCKCPSVVDDLTELVSVGLQCAEAEGTVRIAVQTACMKMFEDLPTGASIEDAVVDKLVPQLLSNVSDTTNYEIRRTAVCAVKQAAKFHNAACQSRAVAIASALVPTAQDLSMRVKRAGERALKHLFRIKRGEPKSDLINALTASGACNAEFSRNLKEISRKFLSVLPEESEDEDPSAGGMIADAW
jgi:HEAT repeat protein/predicted RecB family endonuclease